MITEEKKQIIAQTISNLISRGDRKGVVRYGSVLKVQFDGSCHRIIDRVITSALGTIGYNACFNRLGMSVEDDKFFKELGLK